MDCAPMIMKFNDPFDYAEIFLFFGGEIILVHSHIHSQLDILTDRKDFTLKSIGLGFLPAMNLHQLNLTLPKSLLISTSVLTAGYLAWKIDYRDAWMRLIQPFLISTRIQGAKSCHSASNDTEDYYFEFLRFVDKLIKSEKGRGIGLAADNGKCAEIIFDHPKNLNGSDDDDGKNLDLEFQLVYIPEFGDTRFYYKGRLFYLRRRRDEPDHEFSAITFKWNHVLMDQLLEEVLEILKKEKHGHFFGFFYLTSTLEWKLMRTTKKKRPLDSVILQEGVKEGLVKDVKEFLASKDWYLEKGVPYRRGYLLHGPPGTGKTSVICAIAAEIGHHINILSLSSSFLTDDDLTVAMNKMYCKSIILIEDIDGAFKSSEYDGGRSSETNSSKVTFKGILNALDGVASQEGRIVFITTNHLKKLDPALIRPGRVDVKVLIDYATRSQVEKMFDKFYPLPDVTFVENDANSREKLGKKLGDVLEKNKKKVSMAAVQSLFILYKNDPKAAVENATKHFEQYTDENSNEFLNCYV